jgi:hypothetical protein
MPVEYRVPGTGKALSIFGGRSADDLVVGVGFGTNADDKIVSATGLRPAI